MSGQSSSSDEPSEKPDGNTPSDGGLFFTLLGMAGAIWAFYGATLVKLMELAVFGERPPPHSCSLLVAIGGFFAINLVALAGLHVALAAMTPVRTPGLSKWLRHSHWGLVVLLLVFHAVVDVAALKVLHERMETKKAQCACRVFRDSHGGDQKGQGSAVVIPRTSKVAGG